MKSFSRNSALGKMTFKVRILIFLVISIRNSSCVIEALYDTGRELWKLESMLISNVKVNTSLDHWLVGNLLAGEGPTYREIRNQLGEVHWRLKQVDDSTKPKTIRHSLKLLPSHIILDKKLDTIELYITNIDEHYEEFCQYMNRSSAHDNHALRIMLRKIIRNIEDNVWIIRRILADADESPSNNKNLVEAIADYGITLRNQMCGGRQMISAVLVRLFKIAIIADMKAIIMIAFANIHEYPLSIGAMISLAREQFEGYFGIYVNLFSRNINLIDEVYMRACDPDDGTWTRSESFYELEGFSQAIIFRYHWMKCKFSSCNDVWHKKSTRCSSHYYDDRSGCKTSPTECTYLSTTEACVLKSGPYKFQYVKSKELGSLGRNFECPKDDGYIIEDGKGTNLSYATCACNCYGRENKISRLIMESRVRSNMVIIGLRFVRKNNVLYIQPREGKLLANGHILHYSEKWIPIPNGIKASQIHSVNRNNSVFFLDDIRLPPDYVLTGVKFNKVTRQNVTGFAIQIFGVKFDYMSGQLDSGKKIQEQVSTDTLGKSLSFEAINSIYTALPHTPSPETIKYVSLQRSELRDDFGQSTLPLFDAVSINADLPSVLGGIGIFHKGVKGYAGLISLRVYPIKYMKYFNNFKSAHMSDGRVTFNQSQII